MKPTDPDNQVSILSDFLAKNKKKELSRTYTYVCEECGYEEDFRRQQQQQLYCPIDHSPMLPKMNEFAAGSLSSIVGVIDDIPAFLARRQQAASSQSAQPPPAKNNEFSALSDTEKAVRIFRMASDLLKPTGVRKTYRISDGTEETVTWRPTSLGEIQKKQFSRQLTALLKGMKNFQSYPKTPEEERSGIIKSGIGSLGIAVGLTGAGFAMRGTIGKSQRADIARNAVNRVVKAQRAGREAKSSKEAAEAVFKAKATTSTAAAKAKSAKTESRSRYQAASASFTTAAKNPNLSKGEKEAFKRAHAKWKEANPNREFSVLLRQLKQFDAAVRRDALSKTRDTASLAASLGTLGLVGYAGYRGHGIFKQVSHEIPKVAETFYREAPGVARYAKATMRKVSRAADGIKATAESVKEGPIAEGAPFWMKKKTIRFAGGQNREYAARHKVVRYFEEQKKRSILLPALAGAALGAGFVSLPHVMKAGRRVEQVAKRSVRKVGEVAEGLKKTQSNVQHSTSIYADLGKLYKEAKGGAYNIIHPMNTWRETKAAFKAGMDGKTKYKTRPRPDWALSAKLRIKEFAARSYQQEGLETQENGIPLNGRVAHDRFIKTIHEGDLDRRDRNIVHAGIAGAAAGSLFPGTASLKFKKAGIGAALGVGSVLAIRTATSGHRDIYGDRPRWARQAESLPALGAAGTAIGILAKKAKMFDYPTKKPLNPAIKAGLAGAIAGGVIGGIPALKVGSKLLPSLKSVAIGAAGMGGLVGGGVAVGDKILGSPSGDEAAPFTKRAALGGALLGTVAGAGAVLAAKKLPAAANFIDKHADWRPIKFIQKASLPVATVVGAGVGGVVGADKAGDEGQQVDVINSIQNQKKKEFQIAAYDEVRDARRQAFSASAIAGITGAIAAGFVGHGIGKRGAQFAASARADERTFRAAYAARAEQAARAARASKEKENFTRGATTATNPHVGTPKAEKWDKWQSMKRTAAESSHEGERTAASTAASKWQARHQLSRLIKSTLKEFYTPNQARRADNKRYADPVRGAMGLEGNLVDSDGKSADFTYGQFAKGFYNKGKQVHRWGGRASNLTGDVKDVFAGNPRNRDASGRPQKREWEKSYFKNAVGAAVTAGALGVGAYAVRNSPAAQRVARKASTWQDKHGFRFFLARLNGVKFFDDWAAYNGWDVRDPRGKSARVFAPGSRARIRRDKEWHETKENRDRLHLVAAVAGASIAGIGAAALTRKGLGHPVIPDAVKNIFRDTPLSKEEHVRKAAFHTEAAKKSAAGGNVYQGPWKPKKN